MTDVGIIQFHRESGHGFRIAAVTPVHMLWPLILQTSDSVKTRMKLEKDLARVQDMMSGLNQKGAKLSQAMNTLRRTSSNYAIPSEDKGMEHLQS